MNLESDLLEFDSRILDWFSSGLVIVIIVSIISGSVGSLEMIFMHF